MDVTRYQGLTHPAPDRMKQLTLAYLEDVEAPSDYWGTVDDIVFHREAVTLCNDTSEYLYSEHTPLDLKYVPGSRPELEKIVADVTAPSMSERDKALALLAWVRDLPELQPPAPEKFGGGTEEEVVATRNGNCADQARLFAVLTQIAGIPSRIVLHYGTPGIDGKMLGGHGVDEVHIEGRWAYMDIRGKYFQWPGGRIASARDLTRFPELTQDQPEHVHAMVRKGYSLAESMSFFAGRRITRICNYFVWEHDRYDYRRMTPTEESRQRASRQQKEVMRQYLQRMRDAGLLGD